MRRIIPLLILAGCSPTGPSAGVGDTFAREVAGRVAGPAKTCVPASQNAGLRVINSGAVAYGSGSTLWVNQLESSCPGLGPSSTIIVDVGAGGYCRGDRIRGLEPGSLIPGPTCLLSDWTPYRRPGR